MTMLGDFCRWFAGGPDGYMTLVHCMKGDTFWITLTLILDLAVAMGYVLIARHWWMNEKSLPASQAKVALGQMKRIFIFCGTCGYLFIPIKMFWPAWRLYDLLHDRAGVLHLAVCVERPAAPGGLPRAGPVEAAGLRAGRVAGRVEAEELLPERDQPRPPDPAQRPDAPGGARRDDAPRRRRDDGESLRESLRRSRRAPGPRPTCWAASSSWAGSTGPTTRAARSRFPLAEFHRPGGRFAARPDRRGQGPGDPGRIARRASTFRTDRVKLERIIQNLLGNGDQVHRAGAGRGDRADLRTRCRPGGGRHRGGHPGRPAVGRSSTSSTRSTTTSGTAPRGSGSDSPSPGGWPDSSKGDLRVESEVGTREPVLRHPPRGRRGGPGPGRPLAEHAPAPPGQVEVGRPRLTTRRRGALAILRRRGFDLVAAGTWPTPGAHRVDRPSPTRCCPSPGRLIRGSRVRPVATGNGPKNGPASSDLARGVDRPRAMPPDTLDASGQWPGSPSDRSRLVSDPPGRGRGVDRARRGADIGCIRTILSH